VGCFLGARVGFVVPETGEAVGDTGALVGTRRGNAATLVGAGVGGFVTGALVGVVVVCANAISLLQSATPIPMLTTA
jgi:hypothetical protein